MLHLQLDLHTETSALSIQLGRHDEKTYIVQKGISGAGRSHFAFWYHFRCFLFLLFEASFKTADCGANFSATCSMAQISTHLIKMTTKWSVF